MCHQLDNWEVSCSCKIVTSLLDNILQLHSFFHEARHFPRGDFHTIASNQVTTVQAWCFPTVFLKSFFSPLNYMFILLSLLTSHLLLKYKPCGLLSNYLGIGRKSEIHQFFGKSEKNTSEQKYCKVFFLFFINSTKSFVINFLLKIDRKL